MLIKKGSQAKQVDESSSGLRITTENFRLADKHGQRVHEPRFKFLG